MKEGKAAFLFVRKSIKKLFACRTHLGVAPRLQTPQVAVRCSLRLEVPVADRGAVLVPDSYLSYLLDLANQKFDQNTDRIARFERELAAALAAAAAPPPPPPPSLPSSSTAALPAAGAAAAAPPPQRRRGGSVAAAAAASSDPRVGGSARLEALRRRQAAVLGRLRALELRLGLGPGQLWEGRPEAAAAGAVSAAGAAGSGAEAAEAVMAANKNGGAHGGGDRGGGAAAPPAALRASGGVHVAARRAATPGAAVPSATAAAPPAAAGGGGGGAPRWRPVPLVGPPGQDAAAAVDEAVPRWGHASAVLGRRIYLIGGYGGGGAHARRADVLVYDTGRRTWKALTLAPGSPSPSPRMGHTAVAVGAVGGGGDDGDGTGGSGGGGYVILIGGRTSPVDALSDVWILDLAARTWIQAAAEVDPVTASGAPCAHAAFPGRYRHSAVAVPPPPPSASATTTLPSTVSSETGASEDGGSGLDGWRVVVFGGRNADTVLGDTWVLRRRRHRSPAAGGAASAASGGGGSGGGLAAGWVWQQVTPRGEPPGPRKSHAACFVPAAAFTAAATAAAASPSAATADQAIRAAAAEEALSELAGRMYVHGGTCGYGLHFADTHYLDLDSYEWHAVGGGGGGAGGGGSGAVGGGGGQGGDERAVRPPACFSHTLNRYGPHLLLVGGYPTDHHRLLCVLDTRSHQWRALHTELAAAPAVPAAPALSSAAASPEFVPIRHCAEVVYRGGDGDGGDGGGAALYVLGGGAFCFSFGTVFGGCFELPLADGALAAALAPSPHCRRQAPGAAGGGVNDSVSVGGGGGGTCGWVVRVPCRAAKALKDGLKARGWLDSSRRAGAHEGGGGGGDGGGRDGGGRAVLLPLAPEAAALLPEAGGGGGGGGSAAAELLALLRGAGAELLRAPLPPATKVPLSPAQRLRDAAAALLRRALPAGAAAAAAAGGAANGNNDEVLFRSLLADLPGRWERLGDLALLPHGCLGHPGWAAALAPLRAQVPDCPSAAAAPAVAAAAAGGGGGAGGDPLAPLWRAVAEALGVRRLARQAPVANTGTRDSRAVLLLGSDGWVSHREGGVTFNLDVTRCMFSSGNVTERTRMGWGRGLAPAAAWRRLRRGDPATAVVAGDGSDAGGGDERPAGRPGWAAGETVVDLYCGIGYYTLPLLVVGGVAKVYACEWNPHALEALRRNLQQLPLPASLPPAPAAASPTTASAAAGAAATVPSGPVSARCEVLAGDCRLTAPVGVADRVVLGLLPSSRGGWATGLRALKPDTGGWLHVHHNVTDREEAEWLGASMAELRRLAAEEAGAGVEWELRLHHVERVKWYAPHIRHIVMDIECRPVGHAPHTAAAAASSPAAAAVPAAAAADASAELTGPTGTAPAGAATPSHSASPAQSPLLSAPPPPPPSAPPPPPSPPAWSQQPWEQLARVRRVVGGGMSREEFERSVSAGREPVVLEGLDLGPAPQLWTPDYLMALPAAHSTLVSVHVSRHPSGCLDFVHKNFAFRTMSLAEMVARAEGRSPRQLAAAAAAAAAAATPSPSSPPAAAAAPVAAGLGGGGGGGSDGGAGAGGESAAAAAAGVAGQVSGWPELVPRGPEFGEGPEVLYLRSIGENPRKEPACLDASFPALASSLRLPPLLPPGCLHSSVLRVSSPGLQLWTHYDVMDNFLLQVRGTKRVLLWPPSAHDTLHVSGSSSPITQLRSPDMGAHPRFASCPPPLVAELSPGDVLFLPSLWFHHVTTTGAGSSVSVNAFYRHLPPECYHKKDLYANRDLVQAEAADAAAEEALAQLLRLPPHYRAFYGARLLGRLGRELGM